MRELAHIALESAHRLGASYLDIRISRHNEQSIGTREERVTHAGAWESFGFGVRVLADGAWGFAASPEVTREKVVEAASRAVALARANRSARRYPVELVPIDSCDAQWNTPLEKDPFTVPTDEMAGLLLDVNAKALAIKGAKYCSSGMHFQKEHKFFASTDGCFTEQTLVRSCPWFGVTATDPASGRFETRAAQICPRGAGYEFVLGLNMAGMAPGVAEDAVRKLGAKSVEPGKYDVILHPSNMWLTIHESIGHSTELDRIMGLEANFAGTSFLSPDQLGKLKLGSDLVNFRADRTVPGGLSTCGYDDDGVRTGEWHLVKNGVLVDFQTTRDQVLWPEYRAGRRNGGLPELTYSHACCYADSWGSFPFQRQPNVHLEPGKRRLSLDELISDTDRGIYIIGDSSYSIDQQRRNFQFSGQVAYEIRKGKIAGMLKDVAYQSSTTEFWNSCDAICDERHWELGGTMNCGKGNPGQGAKMSHGASPARFRGVTILNTRRSV